MKGSATGPSRPVPTTPSEGVGPSRPSKHLQTTPSEGLPSIIQPGGRTVGKSSNCLQNGRSRTRLRERKIQSQNMVWPTVFSEGFVERKRYLATTPFEGFRPSRLLQTTPFRCYGALSGKWPRKGVRDVDGRDGTWTDWTGRYVDGGDGTVRGRRSRDVHTNLSEQHPPWV